MKKRVGIYTIGTMGFLMACGVFGEEPREQVLAGAKPTPMQ